METQQHSINFYKLKAKKLKKLLGIKHVEALNQVAKEHGFSNWIHCQRTIDNGPTSPVSDTILIGFTDWLHKQKNRDSPLGDLARDMSKDATWPSYDNFEDYENYLYSKRAGWQGIETLKKAWKSYRAYKKQKLSPKPKKNYSKKNPIKTDSRKIVVVKNVTPIHYNKRTVEKFDVGNKAWISWDGRKAIPVIITEVDERYYTFVVERPINKAGSEYYLRLDEVRSTPELACINCVTS